jgi:hypothetical protein
VVAANGVPSFTSEQIQAMSVDELRQLEASLQRAIEEQIGNASCSQSKQCRTIAIGANPCGGPESYKAYSLQESDEVQIESLAVQYGAVRKTLHAKLGRMGACIVIPEPSVQCKEQKCVLESKPAMRVF